MHERDRILSLGRDPGRSALATVCRVKGSAYRRPGARMLLHEDGRSVGVISGGCLDGDLWRLAREVMATGEAQRATYDATSPEDIIWGLGLGCRGRVDVVVEPASDLSWMRDGATVAVVFEGPRLGTREIDGPASPRPRLVELPVGLALVQTFRPAPNLWLFGSGADVVPVQRLARETGWRVEVIDLRAPHPDRSTSVPARHVPADALDALQPAPDDACVLMTHRFADDLEILASVVPSPAGYIGVLGPRSRTDELTAMLARRGIEVPPDRLHAPVGLDTGAETPEEIAVSILAEMQAVFAGRSGGFLRDRHGPIHGSEPVANPNAIPALS